MDVDPAMFKKILEYLYMVKILDDLPPSPEVVDKDEEAVEMYVDFFKLRASVSSEAAATDQTAPSTMKEKEITTKTQQELDTIDQELENEESFVASFTKDRDAVDSPVDAQFDDSSCFPHKNDDVSGTETKKSVTFNGIMNLFLNGEIVPYRVKTVCGDVTSLQACS